MAEDGKVSVLELKESLQQLIPNDRSDLQFRSNDIITLIRYMDPDGDGDLELAEIQDAVRRPRNRRQIKARAASG